ncbi:MAG: tRNA (adenosine(37)-N6)-dimethylallyltransferase MiaA [Beggiatoa sp.]|nr:tRNA (adenosine(37)-N6)-dimethylallyltransferase MiaA [Beggiatoa sp.]
MSGAPDRGGRTGPVVFLMGPTGAGKTALALGLAARLPMGLVSVDSAMIYRGLDIGTDKPGATVLARFPHRLIDIRDVDQAYSAEEFRHDALSAIRDLLAHGRIPLLVGGTGLYFRALEHGLSALPGANREVRERLSSEARRDGWAGLHRRLAVLDPEAAARIHPHDAKRIQRALEVLEVTGDSLTTLYARDTQEPLPYRIIKLIIAPRDRERLHAGLRQRFLCMLERGLIDEVRRVFCSADARDAWPAMRLVGYRQVFEYLTGRWDRNALVERAVIATRQLAKRQMTWLRAERGGVRFCSDDPCLLSKALASLADEPRGMSR